MAPPPLLPLDASQLCMVQWDLGGEPLPYPTGVLNRFYLAVDPGAPLPSVVEDTDGLAAAGLVEPGAEELGV